MKNDKLLVPNMFSVLIFKHIFSNLPPDYIIRTPDYDMRGRIFQSALETSD